MERGVPSHKKYTSNQFPGTRLFSKEKNLTLLFLQGGNNSIHGLRRNRNSMVLESYSSEGIASIPCIRHPSLGDGVNWQFYEKDKTHTILIKDSLMRNLVAATKITLQAISLRAVL